MDNYCSTSEAENLSELLVTFKNSKTIDGSTCCRLLKACRSDQDFFILFAYLPKLLKQSAIKESELSSVASCLPIDFLRRLLSERDGEDSESYQNLAIDVLAVVLSTFPTNDIVDVVSLHTPLRSVMVKRRKKFALLNPFYIIFGLCDVLNSMYFWTWGTRDLENVCCVLLKISADHTEAEFFNEVLTTICYHLKNNEKEFPSFTLLTCLDDSIHRLSSVVEGNYSTKHGWGTDLRIVLTRILRTREIGKENRKLCFAVASSAARLLGVQWFNSEEHFAMMLISLIEVEMHLLLEDPETIRVEELISCASLAETFIHLVEEDDFLDDERASQVSKTCQRIVAFTCQYLVEYSKDRRQITFGAEIVLLRLICSFLSIGGAEILDKELLTNVAPLVIGIARKNITFGSGCLCQNLVENLGAFPFLPNNTLAFILDYVETYANSAEVASTVTAFFDEVKNRKEVWYNKEDIAKAQSLSTYMKNPVMQELLCKLYEFLFTLT